MKYFAILFVTTCVGISSFAQDTSRKREVTVTSTFKPSLKEAAKINFNPTPPATDTSRPILQYNVPDQNLFFSYQPGSLKPLALQSDTGSRWNNNAFIKLGYGNLKTPFLQAGASLGDGKNSGFSFYANHHSSKGKIDYQDYSHSEADINAFIRTSKNIEWNGRIGALQEKYNRYGFEDKTTIYHADSIAVKYTTIRGRISFHNMKKTEFGLTYAPELKIDVFNDGLHNSESNSYLNVPLEKSISKDVAIDVAFTGSMARYKPDSKEATNNNYFSFSPSVLFKKPNINFQAGLRPAWDNGNFKLFPNFLAEYYSTGNLVSIQAGLTGNLRNSGFQYLANFNPWIWAPASVWNTQITERFLGVKGSIGDHFSYNGRVAFNTWRNQPLFINDTVTGKSFLVINESRVNVAQWGGELGYTVGEKLSVLSNLTFSQYHLQDNVKPWGLLPFEWKTTLKLQVMQDLYVNSVLYAFDGPWSLTKAGRDNLPAAMDLSAGFEFRVVKNVKLWAQFNNIFNKAYQRWDQYPVYGFNFLGGVVFSFDQKN